MKRGAPAGEQRKQPSSGSSNPILLFCSFKVKSPKIGKGTWVVHGTESKSSCGKVSLFGATDRAENGRRKAKEKQCRRSSVFWDCSLDRREGDKHMSALLSHYEVASVQSITSRRCIDHRRNLSRWEQQMLAMKWSSVLRKWNEIVRVVVQRFVPLQSSQSMFLIPTRWLKRPVTVIRRNLVYGSIHRSRVRSIFHQLLTTWCMVLPSIRKKQQQNASTMMVCKRCLFVSRAFMLHSDSLMVGKVFVLKARRLLLLTTLGDGLNDTRDSIRRRSKH